MLSSSDSSDSSEVEGGFDGELPDHGLVSNGKARNCGKVGSAMAREPVRFLGRLRSCLNIGVGQGARPSMSCGMVVRMAGSKKCFYFKWGMPSTTFPSLLSLHTSSANLPTIFLYSIFHSISSMSQS